MAKITITEEKFQFTYKQHNGLKPHKFIDVFNQRTGRIKRMRTYLPFRGKHTNIRPFRKRMGEKAYTRIVLDFSFRRPPINRWNRH